MNTTRSGDRVVAGKAQGTPGGTKQLTVNVMPKNKTAQLTIKRTLGQQGSASFDGRGTVTMSVQDGQAITIFGGDVSDKPRNMAITSAINGMSVPGTFDFTVFTVDAVGTIQGTIEQALPKRVLANSGRKLTSGSVPLPARTMRTLYQDLVTVQNGVVTVAQPDGKRDERALRGSPDLDRVGHRFLDEVLTYGGIVIKGTIVPSGIALTDFSRKLLNPSVAAAARESFNVTRIKFANEQVFFNGQFRRNTVCINNIPDDSTDDDEDLIPDDGAVWSIDTPSVVLRPSVPSAVADGEVARGRYLFQEQVEYGGVRVSPFVVWSWSYSYINPIGPKLFMQDNSLGANDNKMTLMFLQVPRC
ncbi:MAG: hypothetical protein ABI779_07705 [Acidobacteriota bacterium]